MNQKLKKKIILNIPYVAIAEYPLCCNRPVCYQLR